MLSWEKAIKNGNLNEVKELIKKGADVNYVSDYGWSVLYSSVYYQKYLIAKLLIEHGADVNNGNTASDVPIHTACFNGNLKIIKLLIENKVKLFVKNKFSYNCLHYACVNGKIDIIKLLIENGFYDKLDELTCHKQNALHITCSCGHIDIAKLLIDNGANISLKDKKQLTPLDYLKRTYPQKYEELMVWLSEYHPEMMLEMMASENIQSKGVEL